MTDEPYEWYDEAITAQEHGDWDRAIALVAPHAECYSADPFRHNSHLWHLDLLARAGRWAELGVLGATDRHAARALATHLRRLGRDDEPDTAST
ncbi:hypothetical protein [Actinoplanes utahensis]|uniref:hypothetical protein n=1 Tax=Actinoplanes utahensis TaxID=1869 RepID=UPI000690C7EE|nr:hypothetical protein [Actinoplanes utahensis]